MYIKLDNGVPENYSIEELRRDNVNTSFPRQLTTELLAEYDVYAAHYEEIPDIELTQKLEQNATPTLVDGSWVYQWSIIEKTSEEIAQDAEAQTSSVRIKRDLLLAETDWTALADVAMTAEMATYRQALRDITLHENFPHLQDSDWPEV